MPIGTPFVKGVYHADKAPKCEHLIAQPTSSTSASHSIVKLDHTNTTDQTDQLTQPNASEQAQHKKCRCVALRNTIYCKSHIKLHADAYTAWLDAQHKPTTSPTTHDLPQRKGKYAFADADLRERYERQLSSGGKLLNLADDIALMIALLERLVNDGNYKTGEVLRLIDMQRKCISTMNDLRKTQAKIMTQERTEQLLNRIADTINKHIDNEQIKTSIAIDFVSIAKEYANENGTGGGGA